jgi:predicted DsbA family dithiol-disulfide isomerase
MNNYDAKAGKTTPNPPAALDDSHPELTIEIVSDFICPWCFVADTRLNKAIAEVAPGMTIERKWLPYELNPFMPAEGKNRKEYRSQKFGSWERSLELDAQVKAAGKHDGIEFRHDLMTHTPNTLKAHRVTWLAAKEGKATALAERIMRGYFLEGKDIGDLETLVGLASEIGMDAAKVSAFLATDEGTNEVQSMERVNFNRGVQGVPFIIIGNQEISGAQHIQVFIDALKEVIKQMGAA